MGNFPKMCNNKIIADNLLEKDAEIIHQIHRRPPMLSLRLSGRAGFDGVEGEKAFKELHRINSPLSCSG